MNIDLINFLWRQLERLFVEVCSENLAHCDTSNQNWLEISSGHASDVVDKINGITAERCGYVPGTCNSVCCGKKLEFQK